MKTNPSNGVQPNKHGARYPWTEWFGHDVPIKIVQGADFEGQPHGMAQTARQAAARMGLKIKVRITHNSVTLEVIRAKATKTKRNLHRG